MDVQRADADGTPAWFRLVCMWILCFGFRVKGVQGLRKGLGFTGKGSQKRLHWIIVRVRFVFISMCSVTKRKVLETLDVEDV